MKIFVTGASGFLGAHLCQHLMILESAIILLFIIDVLILLLGP